MSQDSRTQSDSPHTAATMAPQRVMCIIGALTEYRDGLTLTQLWERTQLPKTSLLSILRSLADGGYIISEDRKHRLGPETYRMAAAIGRTDRFPGNVHALLEKLQKDCGETVMIGVAREEAGLCRCHRKHQQSSVQHQRWRGKTYVFNDRWQDTARLRLGR